VQGDGPGAEREALREAADEAGPPEEPALTQRTRLAMADGLLPELSRPNTGTVPMKYRKLLLLSY